MAMPTHSPTHTFGGPGSPSRALNGYPESQLPPSMYNGSRSMLPPSPQHYQPRYPAASIPTPPPSLPTFPDSRTIPPPYKRPGSSMSISSMLGGEPDRAHSEAYPNHTPRPSSRPASLSGPLFPLNGAMSPPQQPSKPAYNDYVYKPRSMTPEKLGANHTLGPTRQRSSSSGTAIQTFAPHNDPYNRSTASTPALRQPEHTQAHHYYPGPEDRNEHEERVRRTSLNGILQRPSSQPQPGSTATQPLDAFRNYQQPPPQTMPFDRASATEPIKQNGPSGFYDTKPPALNGLGKPPVTTHPSPQRSSPHSISPELHRSNPNGNQGPGLAGILNAPTSQPSSSQRMIRQDSAQSQGDRSVLGDRNKFRAYSPFAGSFTSNPDEQGRKGSDEFSQHRALIGLGAESKRGRYSPLPQAVHGAQAQTPIPDAGVKAERGRVFSGIGGGVGATPTSGGSQLSSLRRDDGPMKLSEDNLKTLARSTPGANKRQRKAHDEDTRDDTEATTGEKAAGRKKGKHQHNYKADLEEMATAGFPRRGTPQSGLATAKRTSTPVNAGGIQNIHLQQHARNTEVTPVFKPKKTVRVASVFNTAFKNPRRHLGSFTYRPVVSQLDLSKHSPHKFDVSITPNLLPSFTDPELVNCTYTVHVPRLWLQPRERGLICSEQYLWGSGIYTDDSDPVAAAIHSGFIKPSLGDSVDTALLARIIQDQNPKIDFPRDLKLPEQPLDIEPGKDLNITMVVLPSLEKYETSARFGIRSRSWPDGIDTNQHDGVSFGILRVEFVDVGAEEIRVGRTGQGRRERLRMDLEARRRGLEIEQQKISAAKEKRSQSLRKKVSGTKSAGKTTVVPRSVPGTFPANSASPSRLNVNVQTISAAA